MSTVWVYFLLKWILFSREISLLKPEVVTDGKVSGFEAYPVFFQGTIY